MGSVGWGVVCWEGALQRDFGDCPKGSLGVDRRGRGEALGARVYWCASESPAHCG
jgi:hypothetical protein